jgi:hypothetical protein
MKESSNPASSNASVMKHFFFRLLLLTLVPPVMDLHSVTLTRKETATGWHRLTTTEQLRFACCRYVPMHLAALPLWLCGGVTQTEVGVTLENDAQEFLVRSLSNMNHSRCCCP